MSVEVDGVNKSIKVDTISEVTSANGISIDSVILKDGAVDVQGVSDGIILDADGDTTISADTDDQIDIKIAGADDFQFTANTFTAQSGSTIAAQALTATTIGATGVVTANAGVVVDNFTIDGTEIDLSSGNFTLDVAGTISIDADGGDIMFKDGGTEFGRVYNSSSDFAFYSAVQDKDIKFQGNDGGSTITALTLDMSGAGSAYFNANVGVGGSSNTRALVTGNADVDGNTFSIVSGIRGLDDRDPKPSNFPIGIIGNFANYAGNGGGSPYADVLVFDTFGHSSAGNATALFISKADPNDIKLAQQTTRSTTTFTAGTQVNIDTSSISDASAKENVQNITGALDKIAQLRPVTFEWTDEYINNGLSKNAEEKVFTEGTLATFYEEEDTLPEGKKVGDIKTEGVTPTRIIPDTKVTNVGLIAQEVETVIPTVVHQNRVSLAGSTDYQRNIDYDKLVPHLIGAIKELKAKVEALESA